VSNMGVLRFVAFSLIFNIDKDLKIVVYLFIQPREKGYSDFHRLSIAL